MGRKTGALGALGGTCYRHRWVTLLVWVAGVVCLIGLWTRFGAAAQNDFSGNDPGQTLLNEHFAAQSGDTLTLAIRSDEPITSAAVRARVAAALVPFRKAAGRAAAPGAGRRVVRGVHPAAGRAGAGHEAVLPR